MAVVGYDGVYELTSLSSTSRSDHDRGAIGARDGLDLRESLAFASLATRAENVRGAIDGRVCVCVVACS